MGETMLCAGNARTMHNRGTQDNWYRTFRGYPEMNDAVRGMIGGWVDTGAESKVYLFFREKCGYDDDYSGFLMREAIRGNL